MHTGALLTRPENTRSPPFPPPPSRERDGKTKERVQTASRDALAAMNRTSQRQRAATTPPTWQPHAPPRSLWPLALSLSFRAFARSPDAMRSQTMRNPAHAVHSIAPPCSWSSSIAQDSFDLDRGHERERCCGYLQTRVAVLSTVHHLARERGRQGCPRRPSLRPSSQPDDTGECYAWPTFLSDKTCVYRLSRLFSSRQACPRRRQIRSHMPTDHWPPGQTTCWPCL